MKKIITLFLFVIIGLPTMTNAEEIPMDSAIRNGKLDNGMTYYIRHNEEPKDRVSFYIAQNVGAILENDDQNGLAHFLEHMAFNGTEHFEGKGIIKFLEKHGVTFGANINAYTSQDETVYNLSNVPTTKDGLIDSCLLVLNDWSNYLLLTEEEIEAERGVISEEWRTRRNAQFRLRAQQNKALLFNSKYAKRDVIGDLNVIKTFKPETIRDFYHAWYRTDLQAIIIVGDVDVDVVENSIKKIFSKIPAVENAAKREYFELPDNQEPLYSLATDKEATHFYTMIAYKMDAVAPENKDLDYLKNRYVKSLFNKMINNRFKERIQQQNCPYIFAQASIGNMIRTKDMATYITAYMEGNWETAIKETTTILEKIKRYGFTQGELDRARKSMLAGIDNAYKMRDKVKHDTYAMEYKDHYMDNTPIPGIEYEKNLADTFMPTLQLSDLQKIAQNFLKDENMVIVVFGPDKEGAYFQTKDEVVNLVNKVRNSDLEAYEDTYVDKPLISEEPVIGKIVNRKTIEANELKATELELSNGIRVLYRHSDIEKESIKFTAQSWGGSVLLSDDQIPDSEVMNGFVGSYGIGDFSATELQKKLSGKIVSVGFGLSNSMENLRGGAAPKDLETMFQLIYLRFTKPRFDQDAYKALYPRYEASLENQSNDVGSAFNDSISVTMADHNPKVKPFTKETLKKVSFEGTKAIYEDRFKNPADFVFTFSGNFEPKILESFIEKYLASLPTTDVKESYVDNGVRAPESDVNNHFQRKLETAKSTVYVNLHKNFKYNQENRIYGYVISKLLAKRYLEEIREKEGGTYGVSVRVSSIERPENELRLSLKFDCDPEKADKLKGIALKKIEELINGKIIENDLTEVKSNILKNKKENIEKLSYWHRKLNTYAMDDEVGMNDYEYLQFINSIDSKTIVKKAKKFLKGAVKVEVVMSPK